MLVTLQPYLIPENPRNLHLVVITNLFTILPENITVPKWLPLCPEKALVRQPHAENIPTA